MGLPSNNNPQFAIPGMMPARSPKLSDIVIRDGAGVIEINIMGPVALEAPKPDVAFRFMVPENKYAPPVMEDFTGKFIYEVTRDTGKYFVLRLRPEDAIALYNRAALGSLESIPTRTYRCYFTINSVQMKPVNVWVSFNAFLDATPRVSSTEPVDLPEIPFEQLGALDFPEPLFPPL